MLNNFSELSRQLTKNLDSKIKKNIETFSGNNALNTKELQFILPIYGL